MSDFFEELMFFNPAEAAIIDAMVSIIIPSEENSPGAAEAGVVRYIDRGLAGFMRDLQSTYRNGLIAVKELTATMSSTTFLESDDATRQEIVGRLDRLGTDQPEEFAGQFFRILREHTLQGFFGDPAYGGNVDSAGWKLVGFPGAQWGYTPEQMRPGVDARSIPIFTIKDLFARHGEQR